MVLALPPPGDDPLAPRRCGGEWSVAAGAHAIYLLGVNPPTEASEAELEAFNDFYTNVHLPEVAERRRALRAVRYELVARHASRTSALRAFSRSTSSMRRRRRGGATSALHTRAVRTSGNGTARRGAFGTGPLSWGIPGRRSEARGLASAIAA